MDRILVQSLLTHTVSRDVAACLPAKRVTDCVVHICTALGEDVNRRELRCAARTHLEECPRRDLYGLQDLRRVLHSLRLLTGPWNADAWWVAIATAFAECSPAKI